MEKRPKVGIGAIVLKDGKALLLKRKDPHGEGTWCFPGGHLEFGESLENCARRETREEAGIEIENVRCAGLTNDIFEKGGQHYITIHLLSDWKSGRAEIREPEKFSALGWFHWDDFPRPLFLPVENLRKQGYRPPNL